MPDVNDIVGTALLLVSSYLVWLWWKDFQFYRENNWDFSKENHSNCMFEGEYSGEPTSPQNRLFFGYPLMVLVSAAIGLVCILT